jgi:DNA-binding PadR family transcriptional regulator
MADDTAALTPAVFHILLALADGPLHGYAIMQAVERSAGPSLSVGPGTIYGCLQRMETSGLVRPVELPNGRRRRAYELRPQGRKALETEAARVARLARIVRARRLVTGEA